MSNYYDFRLTAMNGNLRPHDFIFHRVAQGSIANNAHLLATDKYQLYDALAETSMPRHLDNDTFLACFQL